MPSTPIPVAEPPFLATERQNELASVWADPRYRRVLASGAIRSGKTQAAGALLVDTALRHPCKYMVARQTYRALADTIQRALIHGDGPIPPLIPAAALRGQSLKTAWAKKDDTVFLANGAEFVFRSLEEQAIEKIRGHTLGGALVDQAEELRFDEGERIYDELIGRCSDERGPGKVFLIANPAGLDHWIYRRFIETPDTDTQGNVISGTVHFTLFDNAANLPAQYVDELVASKTTRPGWYRTFVLGIWGAIEDAAYLVEDYHLVDEFSLDESISRFEVADYGLGGAPWCQWAVDYEGNLIAVDMIYPKQRLASEVAMMVLQKRAAGWGQPWQTAFMDPSVWHRVGLANKWGAPVMLADEFPAAGVPIQKANNDPRAGLIRVRELLKANPERRFPMWHPRAGDPGSPGIFFTRNVPLLVKELRSAPMQPLGKQGGGEIVDPEWEGRNGHAAAMCRYAVLTRAMPSTAPVEEISDMRERAARAALEGRGFTGKPTRPDYTTHMG